MTELVDVGAKDLRENLALYLEDVRLGRAWIRILRHNWVAAFAVSEADVRRYMPHILEDREEGE